MGGGKGSEELGNLIVSAAPPTTMRSQATSATGSSFDGFSHSNGDFARDFGELPVPELDNDVSTEDFTSDYLSARTSYLGPERIFEPDDEHGSGGHLDVVSIYSPTRYRVISPQYRTERPFDDGETMDSTQSITELDLDYVMENGRRYCGNYYMPNDEDEQVRLQLINQVYLKTFDGELTSIPLEGPTHVLDIGTAVGEWAIDMAERYPDCEVTGTDISNIFERSVPQNVYWEIDDAELEWERPADHYDLVHLRNMAGAFSDWEHIYRSAFTCIKPGGWIEILDFDDHKGMRNFLSFFKPESVIHKVTQDIQEASVIHGKPRGVGHLEPRFLVNAGYVDVQLTEHAIPLRTEDGSTGKFWLLAMLNGIEATALRLLTRYKGWDPADVHVACDLIGQEMMTMALNPRRAKGFVVKVRVVVGRKPGQHSRWSTGPFRGEDENHIIRHVQFEGTETTDGSVLSEEESGYGSYPPVGPLSDVEGKSYHSSFANSLTIDSEVASDAASSQREDIHNINTAISFDGDRSMDIDHDGSGQDDLAEQLTLNEEIIAQTTNESMIESPQEELISRSNREIPRIIVPDADEPKSR
ncbi:S-adenosyl-L-methionine-dependent methyltransferase [Whalleya microplaca]|nr:S-adenosyl-L-methionine-dependent methyltransferase [Whalleya microplaca]